MIMWIFFIMVAIQCVAYLWFQSKGGVVSHRKYIIASVCFMIGQTAQSLDSITKGAYASFAVATFFVFVTLFGIIQRFVMIKKQNASEKLIASN